MNTAAEMHDSLIDRFLKLAANRRVRLATVLGVDAAGLAAAAAASLVLVTPDWGRAGMLEQLARVVVLAILIKMPLLYFSGIYRISAKHLDGGDIVKMARVLAVTGAVFALAMAVIAFVTPSDDLFERHIILDFFFATVFLASARVAVRVAADTRPRQRRAATRPVLIYGAGDAGLQVLRAIREEADTRFTARGFVDDDAGKLGLRINGVPVVGSRKDLPFLVRRFESPELWIAMPSAPGHELRKIVELARNAGFERIKVVPGLGALITGQVGIHDVRDVQLEELLGREPVTVDTMEVGRYITGRTVLVTGASGSIGSELCVQIARFDPARLIVLDQDETGIFDLSHGLLASFHDLELTQVVGDVRDDIKIRGVFREYSPEVVFHAAAYKHVPLMEDHPDQAVKTNVFGTRAVAEAAREFGAETFILISTDKAVNPSSIMGATKRAAEVLVQQLGAASGTRYTAVRFGNVLGSRGSVVPIFKAQIESGGPVTVTDPEMRRYFMTIPEAVLLVLQAGAIGENGQVMVLDMGEPVKIVDLARQLIKLSGLRPDIDIPIVYTGVRPGEKLFEDILSGEEGTTSTRHDRVFVARAVNSLPDDVLRDRFDELTKAVTGGDREDIVSALASLVTTYRPHQPGSAGARRA